MRNFFWSLLFTIILLVSFAQIAAPILQGKSVSHVLPVHRTLFVERNIPDDEMLYILQAAMEWNQATDGQVVFDIQRLPNQKAVLKDAIVIINVNPDYPDIILLDQSKGYSTLGFCNSDSTIDYIALVNSRLDEDTFTPVMLHELGHALGLEHVKGVEGIGTLMYPTIDAGSKHITENDLMHFCKLYNCDSSKFHGISEIQ